MKYKLPLSLLCLFFISCEQGDVEIFDSRPIFSSSFQGNWVLVNYWADWCPPCIKEIPELHKFMSNNFPDVPVLFIDPLKGDSKKDIKNFSKKLKLTFLLNMKYNKIHDIIAKI